MPDISMCMNEECKLAKTCYRSPKSGAKPSSWQSWAGFEPKNDTECDSFMEVWEKKDAT